jgi:hypothetical protein
MMPLDALRRRLVRLGLVQTFRFLKLQALGQNRQAQVRSCLKSLLEVAEVALE